MRKIQKVLLAMVLCATLIGSQFCIANASEATSDMTAVYDLKKGGTQSFTITEDDGSTSEIIVEELPAKARVNNGNYKISRNLPHKWSATFYVNISSNKITKAYNPSVKALLGSITNVSLKKNSSSKATLSFLHVHTLSHSRTGIAANIQNSTLFISRL